MPNAARVQVQCASPRTRARSVHRPVLAIDAKYCTGTSTACESKHADHRAISASPRLSMPNAVHYVSRPGYPCQIPYGYKYSVRVQTRWPSCDRCTTSAVHEKCGMSTSKACEPTHAGTMGASPSPYHKTVRVQVQRASRSTRSGCPCRRTVRIQVQHASPNTRA